MAATLPPMPRPEVIRSTLLAAPHAFTTRRGGVSTGIFDSLNFGNPSDLASADRDPPERIHANFALVLRELACAGREIVEVHQVHGGDVHIVRRGSPSHPTPHDTKADGLVTDDPGRVLAIRVADCAPVLLSSEDGFVVGAAHAGWRGIIAGVVPRTAATMREIGAGRVAAAVGPCISVEHFEVGPEVAAEFDRVFGAGAGLVRARPGARPTVDLKRAIRLQLEAVGVDRVEVLPHCTFGEPETFFSHRRDQGRTGRMVGVIGPRQEGK